MTPDIERIYEASFPRNERRPLTDYPALCAGHPEFHEEVLVHQGRSVGLMFHWQMKDFTYLEHFAIDPELRNGGLGSAFLDAFLSRHERVILEVEPPEDVMTRRRIAFYERHGLSLNPLSYWNPGYEKGTKPYRLNLMTKPVWSESECRQFLAYLFDVVLPQNVVSSPNGKFCRDAALL